jgi:DNA modification methylase
VVAVSEQAQGSGWHLYNDDCCKVLQALPENSLHYGIWSPPFESLYVFSDDPRDMSNCADSKTFWEHYNFLCAEVYRTLKPGRIISVHCMDLPTSKTRDGFIGIRDFPGEIIRAHERSGMIFHSRVLIWKSPVVAMQRSKSIGLLHKQLVKDSAMSRMGIADYMVMMRKPGDNDEPISGPFDAYYGSETTPSGPLTTETGGMITTNVPGEKWYSVAVWQRYASPVWMDIDQSDVLSRKLAREVADERHVAPLQLTPIRRCLDIWSNPGDVVFSPFAGIGSELYCAVEMGRKAIGVELKPSYFRQAIDNIRTLESKGKTGSLFDHVEAAE